MSTTYPPGNYHAKVTGQGFEESSTGTPCFYLQLSIQDRCDDQGQLQECPRYERTYRQYLANDTGVKILLADLKALGAQVTDFAQLDPAAPNGINLIGRKLSVVCEHETYQGKLRERWGFPRSRKKVETAALRALGDRFGHLLRDGGQGPPAPPVARPNESETPF